MHDFEKQAEEAAKTLPECVKACITHRVNNHLTAVAGFLSMMKDRPHPDLVPVRVSMALMAAEELLRGLKPFMSEGGMHGRE